jgi:hypothetical protein
MLSQFTWHELPTTFALIVSTICLIQDFSKFGNKTNLLFYIVLFAIPIILGFLGHRFWVGFLYINWATTIFGYGAIFILTIKSKGSS